ncbi:MAG: hypothetical protein KR126chlam5_00682 [Candidatus Anoxychlamydiales bacterium]|nr:hypothetical protein [Candidatus Anoxychlamydiales bacterium]
MASSSSASSSIPNATYFNAIISNAKIDDCYEELKGQAMHIKMLQNKISETFNDLFKEVPKKPSDTTPMEVEGHSQEISMPVTGQTSLIKAPFVNEKAFELVEARLLETAKTYLNDILKHNISEEEKSFKYKGIDRIANRYITSLAFLRFMWTYSVSRNNLDAVSYIYLKSISRYQTIVNIYSAMLDSHKKIQAASSLLAFQTR